MSRKRQIPMRVLPLSLCRTSEVSLGEALKTLGYKPFGMAEATKNPSLILGLWRDCLDAKYNGRGKPWGKKEFDAMLSEYDSVLGVPCCLYAEDLVKAYPDAKVILTKKSPQSWANTMLIAGQKMVNWRGWDIMIAWDKLFSGPLIHLIRGQMKVMCNDDYSRGGHAEKFFEAHEKKIRELVPKEKLLELEYPQTWKPLCDFLDQPVPNVAYPFVKEDTDDEMILRFQGMFWYVGMARSLSKMAFIFVGLPLMFGTAWMQRSMIVDFSQRILNRTF